jgi:hypothetical protein
VSLSAGRPRAPSQLGEPAQAGTAQEQAEPGQDGPPAQHPWQPRPLVVAGGMAAGAAAASGLAVLTTITAIGWITAPHVGIGSGLPGVLRTAGVLWLVAHHVGVTVGGFGRIGLLPLGLVLLPGLLLVKAGRWLVHAAGVTSLRNAGYAALALAFPYSLLTGAVAVASGSPRIAPSLWQAVVAGFLLAFGAGGLGVARGLVGGRKTWPKLVRLVEPRPRSVLLGVFAALAVLTACGALLAGGSLAARLPMYRTATDALAPGPGGAAVLLLAGLCYMPNAVVWAIAYMLGPGFAFGTGTIVAPTGSVLSGLPEFPSLAALPDGLHRGAPLPLALAALAAPYAAGVFAGLVTIRVEPTLVLEAAPLWGFATGTIAGLLTGLAGAFAGGPLGSGRLAATGPNGLQTAIVAVLEVGVTSAVVAGGANWLVVRKRTGTAAGVPEPAVSPPIIDYSDDADGHRIYIDPWGDDDELRGNPERAAHGVSELRLACLPRHLGVRPRQAA